MTKVGKVTQIDRSNGMVKVTVEDHDNIESDWLVMSDKDNDFPKIGSIITATFDNDDFTTGICHGNHFSSKNQPLNINADIIYQRMGEDIIFEYKKSSKELTIYASKVLIKGDVDISGDLTVENITAKSVVAETITEGGK